MDVIAEQCIVPFEGTSDGACIGINEKFVDVETMAIVRVERTVDAIGIDLSGFEIG